MSRLSDPSATRAITQQILQLEEYIATTELDRKLIHLVKLRASQINGCAYCMAMHVHEALQDGDRIDRLSVISAWRETSWFSERECAALAWTESVTELNHGGVPDDVFETARDQFGEKGLADLTLLIITINAWNRIAIPFHSEPDAFTFPGSAG
ncbi:MAG: carboxymuconolactone decarboxylase family protein [Thermomicrobiales bacterium]